MKTLLLAAFALCVSLPAWAATKTRSHIRTPANGACSLKDLRKLQGSPTRIPWERYNLIESPMEGLSWTELQDTFTRTRNQSQLFALPKEAKEEIQQIFKKESSVYLAFDKAFRAFRIARLGDLPPEHMERVAKVMNLDNLEFGESLQVQNLAIAYPGRKQRLIVSLPLISDFVEGDTYRAERDLDQSLFTLFRVSSLESFVHHDPPIEWVVRRLAERSEKLSFGDLIDAVLHWSFAQQRSLRTEWEFLSAVPQSSRMEIYEDLMRRFSFLQSEENRYLSSIFSDSSQSFDEYLNRARREGRYSVPQTFRTTVALLESLQVVKHQHLNLDLIWAGRVPGLPNPDMYPFRSPSSEDRWNARIDAAEHLSAEERDFLRREVIADNARYRSPRGN